MLRKYLALAFLLPLLACAHNYQSTNSTTAPTSTQKQTQFYWLKPDYTQQGFNADRYQCLQSSITQSQPNGSVVVPDFTSQMMQMSNQNNLFSACMHAKGYVWQQLPIVQDPVSDNLDNKAAYCLVADQSMLANMEKYEKTHKNDEYASLQKQAKDETNYDIQLITQYLQNRGLYSTDPTLTPTATKTFMDKAKVDIDEFPAGKSAWGKCIGGCSSGKEYLQCYAACDQYMSSGERRRSSCIGFEKQLPAQ
jgi:hypothetical protein